MPLTRLGDFIVGICLAFLVRCARVPSWVGSLAQMTGAGLIIGLMLTRRLLFTAWSWDIAYLVPAALLLWGLASAPRTLIGRFLGSRPMVLLGEASFAFYLLHVSLLPRLEFSGAETWRGKLFVLALQFVFISLVSIGAHIAIERPLQRWLRRVLDRHPARSADDLMPVALRDQVLI